MTATLQVLLVIFSVLLLILIIRDVSRSKIIFSDFSYWLLFSIFLILIAIFPKITEWLALLMGIKTVAFSVFLMVVTMLIMLTLSLSFRISILNRRFIQLTQNLALLENENARRLDRLEKNLKIINA
ncbi:DUF2304 domain-containing protein [Aggregatibacter actinomycetemcomitans]|uniref:DUF2304 domain-containing protein n=1 Tax=Aggregatibacter actinomycetemcomitans TaxID=714 RepID=Q9AQB1_AGGAC|nr:DUF2304 domain-containing protein [Aggregatibacter actinomycetemcomitans]AAG49412.1 unknown [Aggregatibacter actinomycetemcomitans]KOE69931.1 hypothetical protein D18P1_0305530 [Aggregatibacter actinomycetemcomitans serotype f str. D18P1]KYK88133.1 hypothetical protein SC29R_04275 [Aggregatibacter actinomycetemcomitans serotype f str. SC29R]MBN6061158.1 DUF2304 domain-containing protein [Aggregatibacter actinomycetemcomitans]MBN6064008.1 DUF2304 domain-containing protein [Aggregatibacter ac